MPTGQPNYMSKWPVGTRWRAVGTDGSVGEVTLARREGGLEMWVWKFQLADGTKTRTGWKTRRLAALRECRACFYPGATFAGTRLQFRRQVEE